MRQHTGTPRVPVFSLGERIRKAREDMDLSQNQFADLLGVDRKTVGNWEAGRNQPRYGDLMLIASVTEVSLQWLAGDLFRPHDGAAAVGGEGRRTRGVQTQSSHEWMSPPRPGRAPVAAASAVRDSIYRFEDNLVADVPAEVA